MSKLHYSFKYKKSTKLMPMLAERGKIADDVSVNDPQSVRTVQFTGIKH